MALVTRLKPGVSLRARLVLAAAIWTAVGTGLLVAGVRWLAAEGGVAAWAALAAALVLGALKGRYVLARRAASNVARLEAAGDDRCVGGVFTWGTWALVAAMMALGATLRMSPIPRFWLGLIYAAAGSALLGASAVTWKSLGKRGKPGGASNA